MIRIKGKRVVGKAENNPAQSGPTSWAMLVTNRITREATNALARRTLLLNFTLFFILDSLTPGISRKKAGWTRPESSGL